MIKLDINNRKEAISLDQSETVQKNCQTKKRLCPLRLQTIKTRLNLFRSDLFSLLIVVITSENHSITPVLLLQANPQVIVVK